MAEVVHEGPVPLIEPGAYPAELLAACKLFAVSPDACIDWAVRSNSVTLVLPLGSKVRVDLAGTWKAQPVSPAERAEGKRAGPRKS